MYVGVIHKAIDRDRAAELLTAFDRSTLPQGLSNPMTLVSADADYVFCLWEAPSVEAVRTVLDPFTGTAVENTYFAVDPEAAATYGFPGKVHTAA